MIGVCHRQFIIIIQQNHLTASDFTGFHAGIQILFFVLKKVGPIRRNDRQLLGIRDLLTKHNGPCGNIYNTHAYCCDAAGVFINLCNCAVAGRPCDSGTRTAGCRRQHGLSGTQAGGVGVDITDSQQRFKGIHQIGSLHCIHWNKTVYTVNPLRYIHIHVQQIHARPGCYPHYLQSSW